MNLKILLPFRIFSEIKNVSEIVLETSEGFYGLLPHRLDFVAAIVPGIFTYHTEGTTCYLAVDEGILVKAGTEVLLSVRDAIKGTDLGKLNELIKKEFTTLDETEKSARKSMIKLENGLINSMEKFRKE